MIECKVGQTDRIEYRQKIPTMVKYPQSLMISNFTSNKKNTAFLTLDNRKKNSPTSRFKNNNKDL